MFRVFSATVFAVVASAFIQGCASLDEIGCRLSDEQQSILKPRLIDFVAYISVDNITFDPSFLFTKNGNLQRPLRSWHVGSHKCFAFLFPVDTRPGYSVLDGEGAIIVDMRTLQPEKSLWFSY